MAKIFCALCSVCARNRNAAVQFAALTIVATGLEMAKWPCVTSYNFFLSLISAHFVKLCAQSVSFTHRLLFIFCFFFFLFFFCISTFIRCHAWPFAGPECVALLRRKVALVCGSTRCWRFAVRSVTYRWSVYSTHHTHTHMLRWHALAQWSHCCGYSLTRLSRSLSNAGRCFLLLLWRLGVGLMRHTCTAATRMLYQHNIEQWKTEHQP